MKRTTPFLAIALLAVGFVACKNTDFKKTKDGFPYKVYSDGKGEKIMPGYVVRIHQTNKLEDSLMATTYGSPAKWVGIPKQGDQNPMTTLLLEARKGDSILVIQAVDSILKQNPQMAQQDSFFVKNKGKNLKTYIKIVEVYKDENLAQAEFEKENIENFNKEPANAQQKAKDDATIQAYLKTANITTARTPWGTYVQTITPGSGPKPKNGQFMMLKYTGKDFNGVVFDTNDKPGGQLLPVQIGAGGMITGFQDGVKQLSKGAKAVLYIPSGIAYGPQGNPPTIQPNQNIMFDIEVVDISDKQPAPPTMPQPDTTRKR